MKKVFTSIFCLVVFLTNAQISPFLNYESWLIEQIETEGEIIVGDEEDPGYLFIYIYTTPDDMTIVGFETSGCSYALVFDDENQMFTIFDHGCTLSNSEYSIIEQELVVNFFLETFHQDAENCDCPYTYEFREEGNKIYLDITNIEGSVATLSNTTLSNTDFENVELAIYPNPTSNLLHIETKQTDVTAVEIFDIQGKSVKQVSLVNETNISVSDLANGMYFIKIATANGQVTRKFVKK